MSKIDTYVREGVTDTRQMKRLLKIIVKTEMFKGADIPERSNKRFFPRTSTIRNHITHTKQKLYHSMIDQDCLQEKIKQWKLSDKSSNIFFRPKSSFHHDEIVEKSPEDDSDIEEHHDIRLGETETTPFLFVNQNGWQKRLFGRYGNELTLLDPTYRTTRYALPLFFLVVKTNIEYQIVAVLLQKMKLKKV